MYVQHLIRIRTLIYLESATPAVDQPFVEVDRREVDKGVVVPLSTLAWYTAAMLPLLLSFTRNTAYPTKRNNNDDLQYIQSIEGTQFPKD